MSRAARSGIRGRLATALWGSALAAFVVAGVLFALYQSFSLERRARQIMEPYAYLVAVGTNAAVDFEDPVRAEEILSTLRANPHIVDAELYLEDGRLLARFQRSPTVAEPASLSQPDGLHVDDGSVVLLETLTSGARLHLRMERAQLIAQFHESLWVFGAAVLALLAITLVQLALLRRAIVNPIASLTEAAEHVRLRADYSKRVPVSDTDELGKLGESLNAMMEGIRQREIALRRLTDFQHAILHNAAYGIISTDADGLITSFNPAAERLLGYTADEAVGKLSLVHWLVPEELVARSLRPATENGQSRAADFEFVAAGACRSAVAEREWTFVRKSGQRVPVLLSLTALRNERNSVTGFVGLTYDLTERRQTEERLRRLNRELLAISDCNQILVRAEQEQALLDDICRIVCDKAGYRMAWVGYMDEGRPDTLRPVAWSGEERGYIRIALAIRAATGQFNTPADIAMRTGQVAGFSDIANDAAAAPWREAALQRGYRSSISLPLVDKGQSFGLLSIYADEADAFTVEEQRLLGELADDLAFGIATLRARAEHARSEEQIQIAATAFEAQEGIIITDATETILRVNRAFSEITGFAAEEVIGRTPRLLSSGRHDAAFFREIWDEMATEGAWQGEIWNRRKDGELFPGWLTITAVKNTEAVVTHYVGTMVDITERKESEQRIEQLAFYDLLTRLPNRRLFIDRLQKAAATSARTQQVGALLFIDLDNFKMVNDTCGHDVGDRLLIEVAHRLTACLRSVDTIARLGGDEFVAMLEDLGGSAREAVVRARAIATKLLDALNQPYEIAGRVHHSTPSIGATLFDGDRDNAEELLKQADIAMYQAKSAGRNTLRFFDPEMQAAVAARASLEADLREAVAQARFELYLQPQVDHLGRIIGAEALLRWLHPQRGAVSPAEFIPLAEETGLILPIGRWILERACMMLDHWNAHPVGKDIQLAINVSASQFRQTDFVAAVSAALVASKVPPGQLKMELTESLVLDNVEETIQKMHALREIGVVFSMDDFGTGYSSLSYLTRLPLHQLKIDQSFVCRLPDSGTDAVVTQSIITLGQSLGLDVIAEGVETEAQRQFLETHGCSTYQGYLTAPPMPQAEFERLLDRQADRLRAEGVATGEGFEA